MVYEKSEATAFQRTLPASQRMGGMMAEEEGQAPHAAEVAGVAEDDAEAAPAEQPDTPTTFLTKLSGTLKGTDGIDDDLAGILIDHLLTVAPHANAVANAKAAIVALSAQRAALAPPEGEAVNG